MKAVARHQEVGGVCGVGSCEKKTFGENLVLLLSYAFEFCLHVSVNKMN